MGGKGYKSYTSLTGKKVSGDWEDSDRGAGNRATRRSGGKVKAKSPTYLAHVHNKGKKKVDPEKNPAVKEHHQVDANGKVVEHGDGTPSSVEEAKKKGLDGKECWDGYKLAGTKKKGGKTVDNCVKEEDKAFEYVKKQIAAKYGKSGYVSKDNPRKPQSSADKAKARAHQAKVDKENAAERAKDPSQGRYPKG